MGRWWFGDGAGDRRIDLSMHFFDTNIGFSRMKRFFASMLGIAFLSLLASCGERTVTATIKGFNHTKDRYIHVFFVNGAMGPNVEPEGGGGKRTCCVLLPAQWRPGMRARISWEYGLEAGEKPLPEQSVEVEIPRYGNPVGDFHVHFYNDHKVKVVVSSCSPEHPLYPMDDLSRLPWKADSTMDEYLKWESQTGERHEC
ncbi:DUF3304 domain-containing protein [Pseudoduganella sp.]|uniref:DUF3304 domain-containing protein n=1 Tax=Pseudoduganella sp. TaxID=1880898 RepID=UPI0035ADCF9A